MSAPIRNEQFQTNVTPVTSLFRDAENTSAYFKAGVTGFAGTGKSKTAAIIARGLVKLARELRLTYADKPVYYYDTETGSDFLRDDFKSDGIALRTLKSRAFVDLLAAVREAEVNGAALIVDSVTHPWKELCETYRRTKGARLKPPQPNYRLQFQDWAYLKEEWGKFTDAFVNSQLHIVMCGRCAFEYDFFEDDDGKKQLEKTDIKMAAEKDAGYEPSILVYMERHRDMETMQAYRTATVLKDRADVIDGAVFRNPTFENFMPHVQRLNLGGQQLGVDTTRNSAGLVPQQEQRDDYARKRRIVVDEIQTLMTLHFPGQTAKDKTSKLQAMLKHFNACWAEIEEVMPLFDLRAGFDSLHQELEGKPSKYSQAIKANPEAREVIGDFPTNSVRAIVSAIDKPATQKVPLRTEINDSLPDGLDIPAHLRRAQPDDPKPNGVAVDHNTWIEEFVGG